jgi:hypothetical protein
MCCLLLITFHDLCKKILDVSQLLLLDRWVVRRFHVYCVIIVIQWYIRYICILYYIISVLWPRYVGR